MRKQCFQTLKVILLSTKPFVDKITLSSILLWLKKFISALRENRDEIKMALIILMKNKKLKFQYIKKI